jgi:hypothetical protein
MGWLDLTAATFEQSRLSRYWPRRLKPTTRINFRNALRSAPVLRPCNEANNNKQTLSPSFVALRYVRGLVSLAPKGR